MKLPEWFYEFLALDCKRAEVLNRTLKEKGLQSKIIELGNSRFVIAKAHNATKDRRYRQKIITAHFDRVHGTLGALDNSSSCLCLVDFLFSKIETVNTTFIFTDKEEAGKNSPFEQGSYSLGLAFSQLSLNEEEFERPLIFSLDVCGRGDSLVISESAKLMFDKFKNTDSTKRALITAEIDSMNEIVVQNMTSKCPIFRTNIPFGEDLGFFLAGFPSMLTTVLPKREAQKLVEYSKLPSWTYYEQPGSYKPETWTYLHSMEDSPDLYTDSAFVLMKQYLQMLSQLKIHV